ncbi:protein HIDE1 [Choloepus didactylus]|uniref:protein HIDE1 n=1 Tax=Choloepus didactylus TaxID=27675 RepID=UPI0018A06430|nr:protein HIDE1 [Choloepus didactylus]XP_037674138.1 protein HIDE1 [Choloepus didactylus]
MTWAILLFAAGCLAIPAPSILLVPPYPSSQGDPIHIACMAPDGFPGANFTLYHGGQVLQSLQAPADQRGVTFNVSGSGGHGGKAPGGAFHCQYGVMGEHSQPQLSDLSQPMHVTFPVATWILALSLSLAGAFLLLMLLGTVTMVIRKVKAKNLQKKRDRESCWAQVNFATTDMSFDNSLFAISTKRALEEDTATLEARPGSAAGSGDSEPRKRPTSTSSSPEPPEFSTFRACQ